MLERIRRLCKEKGISIAKLEKDLGFANGSIAKSDEKIQSIRLWQIADYFNVTMEYLLNGIKHDPDIQRVIQMIAELGYTIRDQDNPNEYLEYDVWSPSLYIDRDDQRVFDICKYTKDDYMLIRPDMTAADFVLIGEKLQNALSHILNDRGSLITSNESCFGSPEITQEEKNIISMYRSSKYKEIVSLMMEKMP